MIYISYSRADADIARKLVGRLRQQGIECWFDESNIPVGEAFVARLGEALRNASGFLLLDSVASRQSYWVLREATTAFRYKREGRFCVMIRVSLDSGPSTAPLDWDGLFDFNDNICEQLGTFLRKWAVSSELAQIPDRDTSTKTMQRIDFEQPTNWIGRQDELRDLDNWWFGEMIGSWISGLGGIGKSGLIQTWITALEYLGYDTEISPSIFFISGRSIRYSLREVEGFRD